MITLVALVSVIALIPLVPFASPIAALAAFPGGALWPTRTLETTRPLLPTIATKLA